VGTRGFEPPTPPPAVLFVSEWSFYITENYDIVRIIVIPAGAESCASGAFCFIYVRERLHQGIPAPTRTKSFCAEHRDIGFRLVLIFLMLAT
jgi:hypothetical protein